MRQVVHQGQRFATRVHQVVDVGFEIQLFIKIYSKKFKPIYSFYVILIHFERDINNNSLPSFTKYNHLRFGSRELVSVFFCPFNFIYLF